MGTKYCTKGRVFLPLLLTLILVFSKACILNLEKEVFQRHVYQAATQTDFSDSSFCF